jgi:hypothetical protein
MKHYGVHGIRHEHVWPEPDCDLVIAFSVKTQAVGFGLP